MSKSPLKFFNNLAASLGGNALSTLAHRIKNRAGRNSGGGNHGQIMSKLNEISNKLSGGANTTSPAPTTPATGGTPGLQNNMDDVQPTMIDPTQVDESMMGNNAVINRGGSALNKVKKYKGKCKIKKPYKK